MGYKLVISEYADELINNLIYYLIYRLKNEQAAKHLLDGIDSIYDRLETNPFQFPLNGDAYLANKGYHEAVVPQMDYIVIFDVREENVNVVGIFHQNETFTYRMSHRPKKSMFSKRAVVVSTAAGTGTKSAVKDVGTGEKAFQCE